MLLFLTLTLTLSSLAMALLLYAKHWELTTGRVLFSGLRPYVSRTSGRFLAAFERHLPNMLARAVLAGGHWIRIHARDIVARILITIETTLQATLDHLKHGMSSAKDVSGQAPSAFLREVAEHKRKLTRVARVRRPPVGDGIAEPENK